MQTEETAPTERRCPRCSSVVSGEARFCGVCGMEVTPRGVAPAVSAAPEAPVAPVAPVDEPPTPPATPQSVAPAAPPVATSPVAGASALDAAMPSGPVDARSAAGARATPTGGRVCNWCGAVSSLHTGPRCPACGAVFPTPEGDAALERASQARIQAMESGMKLQSSAQQRSTWWPFRPR